MSARNLEQLREQYKGTGKTGPVGRGHGPRGRGPRGKGPGGKPKDMKSTVNRLFKYIGMYKVRLIFVVLCMLCSTISQLAGGYVLRPVINGLVAADKTIAERTERLIIAIGIMIAIYLVGVVFTYIQQRLMLTVSQSAIEKVRNDLFAKIQTLPVRFFDTNPTGEVMSRFTNDVDNIGVMLDNSIIAVISGSVTLVSTIIMMFYTNVWLSLITVVFTPIFIFGGASIAKISRKYYSAQQSSLGCVNGYIEESVTGQYLSYKKHIPVHSLKPCHKVIQSHGTIRAKSFKAAFATFKKCCVNLVTSGIKNGCKYSVKHTVLHSQSLQG